MEFWRGICANQTSFGCKDSLERVLTTSTRNLLGVDHHFPSATAVLPDQRQLPRSFLARSPRPSGDLPGGGGSSLPPTPPEVYPRKSNISSAACTTDWAPLPAGKASIGRC